MTALRIAAMGRGRRQFGGFPIGDTSKKSPKMDVFIVEKPWTTPRNGMMKRWLFFPFCWETSNIGLFENLRGNPSKPNGLEDHSPMKTGHLGESTAKSKESTVTFCFRASNSLQGIIRSHHNHRELLAKNKTIRLCKLVRITSTITLENIIISHHSIITWHRHGTDSMTTLRW